MKHARSLFCLALASTLPLDAAQAVGYANVVFPSGFTLVGKQLDSRQSETVATEFDQVPTDTTIYTFTPQGSVVANRFNGLDWDNPDQPFTVGEGLFVLNPGTSFVHTFVGEILQGSLTNHIPAGYSLRASIIPQEGLLTTTLGLRLNRFDNVYLWRGNALEIFTFLGGSQWHPGEPSLRLAEAFVVHASRETNWVRQFTVSTPGSTVQSTLQPQNLNAEAGGTINFANAAANLNAPFRFVGSGLPLEGPDWKAQLLYESKTDFVPLSNPIPFQSGPLAGYFLGGRLVVPGTSAGESPIFKVRILRGTTMVAETEPFTARVGGGITPPGNLLELPALPVPRPLQLTIRLDQTTGNSVLSWPAEHPNAVVQAAGSLAPTWQSLTQPATPQGQDLTLQVPPNASHQFFRLRAF